MSPSINTPREEWQLNTRHVGQRVQIYDQLDSTNARAAQLADDPGHHGWVIVAEEQTAGRGQHGRTWQAPRGRAVLMSVLLYPPPELRRPTLLTAWAAVSVCETVRLATGLQAKIKWPNDILLRGRKVCGILIESKAQTPHHSPLTTHQNTFDSDPQTTSVVVGIGLNVNQTAADFESGGLPHAGSLSLFTPQVLDCATVTRLLVEQLDLEYDRLVQGDLGALEACWKWHLGLLGKQVVVECAEGRHWGRLRELTLHEVQLEKDGFGTIQFVPEWIEHIEPA